MKPRFRSLIVVVCVLVVTACFLGVPSPPRVLVTEHQIDVAGSLRQYRLVVPDPAPTVATPVVLAFHGTGDSTASMAEYSQLNGLAARHGFILAYPAARDSGWTTDADSDPDTRPDIRFVDRLLDVLQARMPLNRSRVYSLGMSSGATFAQRLAMVRRDIAGCCSPLRPGASRRGRWPESVSSPSACWRS